MGLYLQDEVLYSNKSGWKVNHSRPSLFSDSIIACSHLAKICFYSPKTNTSGTFGVTFGHIEWEIWVAWYTKYSVFLFQLSFWQCISFSQAIPCHTILTFVHLLMILLFKWPPSVAAKVLVKKCKKVVVWLTKKMHMLYKFWPGMSYGPVGSEVSVKESAGYVK